MKKYWFVLLLCFVLSLAEISPAAGEEIPEWVYELQDDGSVMISGYYGSETEVVIPDQLDGHTVTALAYDTFWFNEEITSVEIPADLTAVSDYIYLSSDQKFVTWYGFDRLDPFAMPPKVAGLMADLFAAEADEVQVNPFMGCLNLKKISVAPGNPVFTVMDGMLVNKNSMETRAYPAGLKDTAYTLPEGIRSIGFQTFYGARFDSVTLPESLSEIDHNPFVFCFNLQSVSVESGNTFFSVQNGALISDSGILITYPYRSEAVSYTVPEGVTEISAGAFFGNEPLMSVTLPAGVLKIGGRGFDYCENLKSVVLPEGFLSIGDSAFKNCDSLEEINLPGTINYIDPQAFLNIGKDLIFTVEENTYGALWAKANNERFHFPGEPEKKSRLTQFVDNLNDEEGNLSKFHLHYRAEYDNTGVWLTRDVYVADGNTYMLQENSEGETLCILFKDGVKYTLSPDSKTGVSTVVNRWNFEENGINNEPQNLLRIIKTHTNRNDYIESSRSIDGKGCICEIYPENRYDPEIAFYFDWEGHFLYLYETKYFGFSPAGDRKGELLFTIYEFTNEFDESVFDISDYEITPKSK